MAKSIRIPLAGLALTTLALAAAAQSSNAQAAQTRDYHIESQPLPAAVNDWADQAGMQVMWSAQMPGAQREAPEVAGRFSAPMALERVLQGSGLTFAFLDEQTVAIRLASVAGQSSPSQGSGESMTRSSSPSQGEDTGEDVKRGEDRGEQSKRSMRGADAAAASQDKTISEVVVTGTHIRGIQNETNPVIVIDQTAIQRSGYASTQDIFKSLPQNFSSGDTAQDGSFGIDPNQSRNIDFSSGINLRGLGASSTLVLLNGHRIAPSSYGTSVDVSSIPLAAIDRIEILTNGSSAIYGSDAVGGVVNILLKKDYSGADTSVRYGSVTDGSRNETVVSQTLGTNWSGGHVVGTLQYQDQTALDAHDRSFSSGIPSPNDLLPKTRTYAATISGLQTLAEQFDLYGDAFLSKREFSRKESYSQPNFIGLSDGDARSVNISPGIRYRLSSDWSLELNGLYGRQDSHSVSSREFLSGPPTNSSQDTTATSKSVDMVVNGSWDFTSAGDIGIAMGVSYRKEDFSALNVSSIAGRSNRLVDRQVRALFAEFYVPIIGPENAVPFVRALEVSAAGRLDKYSDFGSTTNPRVGLRWVPLRDMSIRASYGKSFRAPNFPEQIASLRAQNIYTFPFTDPTGTSTVPVLVLDGSQALSAERARTIDVGVEVSPSQIPGLSFAASYYDIVYDDRITTPPFDPSILLKRDVYGSLITPIDSPAQAQQIVDAAVADGAIFGDYSGTGADSAQYLYDFRLQNAARVRQSGVDITSRLVRPIAAHTLALQLNASFIEKIDTSFAQGATATDLVNTFAYPVKWRGRADMSWSSENYSLSGALNVTGSYSNTAAIGNPPIASWTTVDLNATLNLDSYSSSEIWQGVSLSLIALNVLDRDPPYVDAASLLVRVNYDPTNASPLGRFVAVAVRKQW